MNRMADVAGMFKKKLREEFEMTYHGQRFKAKFMSGGLYGYTPSVDRWSLANDHVLISLLIGEAVIVDD